MKPGQYIVYEILFNDNTTDSFAEQLSSFHNDQQIRERIDEARKVLVYLMNESNATAIFGKQTLYQICLATKDIRKINISYHLEEEK